VRSPGNQPNNVEQHYLSVAAAQDAWGITQPQVSRWRTHLEHEDAYRKRMLAVLRRAAGLDDPTPDPVHEVVAVRAHASGIPESIGGFDGLRQPTEDSQHQPLMRRTHGVTLGITGLTDHSFMAASSRFKIFR
jgi:hypothetical protein